MNQVMQGLTRTVDIQANLRGQAGGGRAAGGASINVGDIIINIPAGVTEPVAVGQAAQNGVLAALRARGG